MKVKVLAEDAYRVVAVMEGEQCPVEAFLAEGDANTQASRDGLLLMLSTVAEKGLQHVPHAWWHEANKAEGIYEFVKGPLRLFFFKGQNGDVAVCTSGARKSGQKANKAAVQAAAKWKSRYAAAVQDNRCEVIHDQDE